MIPSPLMIVGAIAGLALLAAAGMGWLLWGQIEKNGALEQSNKQLTQTVKDKEAATKSRVRTNDTVRKMAPADKLERLK